MAAMIHWFSWRMLVMHFSLLWAEFLPGDGCGIPDPVLGLPEIFNVDLHNQFTNEARTELLKDRKGSRMMRAFTY